ncbi:D-alanyl-lipoteichoic acid acyltransferase DltB (MBOAT superfamily) [Lutibacter sp. Hel_I_33_5]|nr:MBOAT family O-acyltransferase [Lutibacter sp. Hel_I_33_5]TVZ56221.1 D-alanyl-lipoteichoic acid acyltransferase DltB (MBOAT superfamily) [Lutibacter sp. Hel_I_33_5]
MLFNSIEFVIFLPITFLIYWHLASKSIKHQNRFLLVASYFFYGCWDWRFLSLIIFSSSVDFLVGFYLNKIHNIKTRKLLLLTSIFVNLSLLGFFKYFNFFAESFTEVFTLMGKSIEISRLNIILPVGISFYTFQTLSYSIDVYRRKIRPTRNILSFFSFVCFFPQLVAGPIERAQNLLPQFYKKRKFIYKNAVDGLRQILWGLFKKVVIADNSAIVVNLVFDNYLNLNGSTLFIGAIFFAFQIYADFSGYSDIAIGTSRLFGFNLQQNFSFPYFSRDVAEFWRRWHISLSTWFRDYLYIPLGGNRGSTLKKVRNIFTIFIISGFWHGANWTFITWGFLNACYFLPFLITKKNRNHLNIVAQDNMFPSVKEVFQMLSTFILTVFAWIFFRSKSIKDAVNYINEIFSISFFEMPDNFGGIEALKTLILICLFMMFEWFGRRNKYGIEKIGLKWNSFIRYSFYFSLIILIFIFSQDNMQFIYFQF